MYIHSYMLCPYLKGNPIGARCGVVNRFIKDMNDVNIKICMSQRHEACTVYFSSLQNIPDDDSYRAASCA